MLLSFRPLFAADGFPINAASILPGLLQKFGDVADILAQMRRGKSWSQQESVRRRGSRRTSRSTRLD